MNETGFNPYNHLTAFAIAAIVTGFTVPCLAGPMVPDPLPWLVVISGTAVSVVAAARLAVSARGKFRIFGIAAAVASLCWLLYLGAAIKDI